MLLYSIETSIYNVVLNCKFYLICNKLVDMYLKNKKKTNPIENANTVLLNCVFNLNKITITVI